MKNKDITSAILGSTFFAIPYIGLSVALAPSLVIGGCAFVASELMFSGVKTKDKLKNTNKSLYQKIMEARKEQKQIKNLIPKDEKTFMTKAQNLIKETNKAFKTILSNLYQKDIIDTDADMKVYELMMKADGIVEDNIIKNEVQNEK